jgi:hypothetical protein
LFLTGYGTVESLRANFISSFIRIASKSTTVGVQRWTADVTERIIYAGLIVKGL